MKASLGSFTTIESTKFRQNIKKKKNELNDKQNDRNTIKNCVQEFVIFSCFVEVA